MKKNNEIRFAISKEEKVKLQEKAEKLGLTLSSYCRLVIKQAKVRIEEK